MQTSRQTFASGPCMWFFFFNNNNNSKKRAEMCDAPQKEKKKQRHKLEYSWHSMRMLFPWNGGSGRTTSIGVKVTLRLLFIQIFIKIFQKWNSKSNRIIHTIQHHVRMKMATKTTYFRMSMHVNWWHRERIQHVYMVLNANQLCNVLHLDSRKSVASLSGYFLWH